MKSVVAFLFLSVVVLCLKPSNLTAQNIRVNQIGYYSTVQKLATVPGAQTGTYNIINNKTGQSVYSGNLPSSAQTWSSSGESVKMVDFSSFTTEGEYYIKTSSETSPVFEIKSSKLYDNLLNWTAKGFYLWRASTAIQSQNATFNGTSYARAAGHADNSIEIHSSAATSSRPAGTKVSAPKGWYDAGDYNLYVINAGVSVFMLAHAYELYPAYFKNQNLNIPESSNSTPDILDEIKWEMDWLLAMQDLDGGVYFKLTSKWFDNFEMPSADVLPRYMVGKSTTSALDFAAMTAMAYRLFKNSTDYPGFADKCLVASEKAWQWAKSNPSVTFKNPSDISTGEYSDTYYGDEFFWAAAELLISTGKQSYYNELNFNLTFQAPAWSYVVGNGIMSLALYKDSLPSFVNKNTIVSKFTGMADNIYNSYNQSVYKVPLTDFYWGSNGDMATRSVVMCSAFSILKDNKYLVGASEGLNYILGRNATGYCFVTGFGDKYPVDIHDRRSQSDGIQNSIPGYLVGGPNLDAQNDCGSYNYPTSTYIAKAYVDKNCSYSTNEIAINWNAPMVALTGMIEAIYNPVSQTKTQTISLVSGWNLMSINVVPNDSNITTLFNTLNVDEIKNYDAFWKSSQSTSLNLLKKIEPGKGYLVKMKSAGNLSVTGTPLSISNIQFSFTSNWQLTGCPFQVSTPFSSYLNSSNCSTIKNFDGFWKPSGTINSIINFEPGKGYFVKK